MPRTAFLETLSLNSTTIGRHVSRTLQVRPRNQIPAFLYGCAWKGEDTAFLVHAALRAGFRGIDVAAQPRHYREDLAGAGMRRAIAEKIVKREELFVQTKFTPVGGQDLGSCPYDPSLGVREQVGRSVEGSLWNLRVAEGGDGEGDGGDGGGTYIDSLVLHSPLRTTEETLEAWTACEAFVATGQVLNLGISNTTLPLLEHLWRASTIKPSVVQNRFYADTGWDVALRSFCRRHDIVYQSFWTLSANPWLLGLDVVRRLAEELEVSKEVALYCLVMGLGEVVCLNGTRRHMQEDLEGVEEVARWVMEDGYEWEMARFEFREAVGDTLGGTTLEYVG